MDGMPFMWHNLGKSELEVNLMKGHKEASVSNNDCLCSVEPPQYFADAIGLGTNTDSVGNSVEHSE